MTRPFVTLTTDFGAGSAYVAALKGALLSVNPDAHVVDLSHQIPPQNLRYASLLLRTAVPYYPRATIHVIVVDPGVGTDRALLLIELAGQYLLVPDNGCWTPLADRLGATPSVIQLTERRYWRPAVSVTFHGRDILAPVAGHLSLGVPPSDLGQPAMGWKRLDLPAPTLTSDSLVGEVLCVDSFGNLITNIPGEVYLAWRDRACRIIVGDEPVTVRVRTYGEAPPQTLVALVSSDGLLEIALTCGNAAQRLGAREGTAVRVEPI